MELDKNEQAELGMRYLTFRTDGQIFGLPITEIVQITQMQEIIELPEHLPYVKGIINLRGQPGVRRCRFYQLDQRVVLHQC